MDKDFLYKHIEARVRELYQQHPNPKLIYHNLDHTINVVERMKEIAAHYHLDENDMLVLYTATWFHDTGYLLTDEEHEQKSCELMREMMHNYSNDELFLNQVEDCIMATKHPQNPKTLLQQIICDADTYHVGTKNFKEINKLVRREFELKDGYVDKQKWMKETVQFMTDHQYFTSYCKEKLNDRKQKNLEWLKGKLQDIPSNDLLTPPPFEQKNSLMTKGIQTMLRLTSDNHLELSGLADGKANILISVNAIIISVILSVLVRRLEFDTHLIIPTIIFLFFSVATIVIAILATRPKVTEGRFKDVDVVAKKTNLLFFGNFYRVPLEDYERSMRMMMGDPEYLYGSLVKDIHQLGVVLGRKYKLIRLAYNIFMIGIIASVCAFTIAVFLNSTGGIANSSSASPF